MSRVFSAPGWVNTTPRWYLGRDLDDGEAGGRTMVYGALDGPFLARVDWMKGTRPPWLTVLRNDRSGSPGREVRLTAPIVREAVQVARWYYPISPTMGIETGGDPRQGDRHGMIAWEEWRPAIEGAGFRPSGVKGTPFADVYVTFRIDPTEMPPSCAPRFTPESAARMK